MIALTPAGTLIEWMCDLIPGSTQIEDIDEQLDGSFGVDCAGETDVCWEGQYTKQAFGPENAAVEMFGALCELRAWAKFMGGFDAPCWQRAEAAIKLAERPYEDVYVDSGGVEWAQSELTLVDVDDFQAAASAGYDIEPTALVVNYCKPDPGTKWRVRCPDATYLPGEFETGAAAWLAAIAHNTDDQAGTEQAEAEA